VSEKKETEYSGLVIAKYSPNSLNARCKVNFNIDTVNTEYGIKLYSPMVT